MLRDVIMAQIDDQLQKLPTEKLVEILNFVESQAAKEVLPKGKDTHWRSETLSTKDCGHPDELAAWRNL